MTQLQNSILLIDDITEIRTLAETLHEEKERLQVTLYSIGDAVLTTDAAARMMAARPC